MSVKEQRKGGGKSGGDQDRIEKKYGVVRRRRETKEKTRPGSGQESETKENIWIKGNNRKGDKEKNCHT